MKAKACIYSIVALLLCGCYPAKIVTVSPYTDSRATYTTTVTLPRSNVVTTTTRVTPTIEDLSLYLDLQAVGAAFAQSSTIEEFESLLNNSSYIISNLDLNNDGYVDYLRVVESVEGYNHVFLIQANLAHNVYQDIATIVAEAPLNSNLTVQIIGAPYIYGPNYILRPIFITRPPIYAYFHRSYYNPWRSPYFWGHFPSYYRRPAPLMLGHYRAYVSTYMHNHRYCNKFDYPRTCSYAGYDRLTRPDQRNDYGSIHPERSFTVRTANIPTSSRTAGSTTAALNARDISERYSAGTTTTTSTASRTKSGSTATAATSSTGSRTSSGTTSATTGSRTSSTAGRSTSATATSSSTSSRSSASTSSRSTSSTSRSTTTSNVRSSGSTSTSISTTNAAGRTSTVSRNSSSSSRSTSAATSSTSRSSYGSSSSSGRSSSSSSRSGSSSSSSRSTSSRSTSNSRH